MSGKYGAQWLLPAVLWLIFSPSGEAQQAANPPAAEASRADGQLTLNRQDLIVIQAKDVEEISNKPIRVDNEGYIVLPTIGRIRAAGLTLAELEAAIVERLRALILNPQVSINILESAKQSDTPIFLVGSFRAPGTISLPNNSRLMDIVRRAGLQQNAARKIKLMRRAEQGEIPLPQAQAIAGNKWYVAEIGITPLLEPVNHADDIELKPFDVLEIGRLEQVFVVGEVNRAGGLDLIDRDVLTVSQAVALSGGLARSADGKRAKVVRPILNSTRKAEIPVNINQIVAGKANDFPLQPNDILMVPGARGALPRTVMNSAITAAVTSVVFVLVRR